MTSTPPHPPSATLDDVDSEIVRVHILPLLNGPDLTAVRCASENFRTLSAEDKLWEGICKSNWPSVADERVSGIVSTFPQGHRSLFNDSYPFPCHRHDQSFGGSENRPQKLEPSEDITTELISAVDIRYRDELLYSKVHVTKTTSDCFLCTPLWIELRDSKEPAPVDRPGFLQVGPGTGEVDLLAHLQETVTLSWLVIDPARKRAVNLSSLKPIWVRRDWLTNDLQIRYVTILDGEGASERVQCRIEVTCSGKECGELQVGDVMMQLHDMDSRCLNGTECLEVMRRAMESRRRKRGKTGELERERYNEFLRMRRERKERIVREERRREIISKSIQVAILIALSLWLSELLFS